MDKEQDILKQLKGKQPFTLPDGYMENLTANIMDKLPEKPVEEEVEVTFMDKMRPMLYLAAVFVGLGLFFKAIMAFQGEQAQQPEPLLVQTTTPVDRMTLQEIEEEEYLDYLEAQYTDYLLDEEMEELE